MVLLKICDKGCRSECREEVADEEMAAEEGCREHRKRRERRDSSAHERKERRALSEERARPDTPPTAALHDYNRLEVERRAERLSRARRPQHGGKRRRAAPRLPRIPKENECFVNSDDAVRCSSPPLDIHLLYKQQQFPAYLDEKCLHRELGGCSPARSVSAQRPPPPGSPAPLATLATPDPAPPARHDKLKRKISNLKKSISKHETDFEAENGQPMTQTDRMTDVQLTRMYETLRKLQSEKRLLKSDPAEYALKVQAAKLQKERDEKLDDALKTDKPMHDLVLDIEEWLEGCRSISGRSTSPESTWTASQLAAEKACVQRALLRLEAVRGRPPAHSADRGASRHLYDRYRAVKKALAAVRPDAMMGNGELATIHEHEAMLFNSSIDSSSEETKDKSDDYTQEESLECSSPPARSSSEQTSSSTAPEDSPHNEGLHCLSTQELDKLLHNAKLHKSMLRRTIKEYEVTFEAQNCRKLQRDDKKAREDDYLRYKAVKARIKLLNALINKQKIGTQESLK